MFWKNPLQLKGMFLPSICLSLRDKAKGRHTKTRQKVNVVLFFCIALSVGLRAMSTVRK